MIIAAVIIPLSAFLAMNMGASGFSVSFTPSYGSNILKRNRAVLLYALCVLLGSVLVGPRVGDTLMKKITSYPLNLSSGIIILSSCAMTMLLSNLLRVPQSTSFVTVASFVGAGFYHGDVHWLVILKIVFFASFFSLSSFFLTILIKRKIYPPHQGNIRFYEKFFIHRAKFKKFIVLHDLYAGFAIGTNNVANVVAPLVISLAFHPLLAFLFISPLFGIGALLFGEKMIQSVSKDIVPIGEFSASIVSLITATFVIIASLLGLPTPYVQFTTFSLIGISCIKDGFRCTMEKPIVKRFVSVWIIVPLFTAFSSYMLHLLFLNG
jgi:phosphate/sulfate permease